MRHNCQPVPTFSMLVIAVIIVVIKVITVFYDPFYTLVCSTGYTSVPQGSTTRGRGVGGRKVEMGRMGGGDLRRLPGN